VSGRSSWCFTGDHAGCRFAACTCSCHAQSPVGASDEAPAPQPAPPAAAATPSLLTVPARPVPAGAQDQLGFPDSLDGSTEDVVTVPISLRGQLYEVDLSREHRQQLEAALTPFIAVARAAAAG